MSGTLRGAGESRRITVLPCPTSQLALTHSNVWITETWAAMPCVGWVAKLCPEHCVEQAKNRRRTVLPCPTSQLGLIYSNVWITKTCAALPCVGCVACVSMCALPNSQMKTGYNMSDNVGKERRGNVTEKNIFHTERYISAHIHCDGNICYHASLRAKEYQLWHKHTPIISLCDPFSRLSPRMTTKTDYTIQTHIGRSVT